MTDNLGPIILYIEDDRASRLLVHRVLTSRGYSVHVASNGLDGIELARQTNPTLILTDINLPDMDGREITTRLRGISHFQDTPIIALTANTSPGSRELALAAGCNGFLTKPIDVATFPQAVKDYLEGREERLSSDEQSEHLQKHAQNLVERLETNVRELETANKRLRELDRLKSDFIIMVSHELRTPLTLISGYSHLLEEQINTSSGGIIATDMVDGIAGGLNAGIGRMREVITEIISVSRISSGTLDLSLGPVRLTQILNSIKNDLEPVCQKRGLKLQMGDVDALPVIEADGNQLRVALENVLGNAIKYTPDGGNVMVVGKILNNAVDIIIQDTGIGIPVNEHRRIFEQFFVLGAIEHHSTSKSAFQGGGLGLGLAITKGIIDAHNGRIWVESKRRDPEALPGSIFHILLPISQASEKLTLDNDNADDTPVE